MNKFNLLNFLSVSVICGGLFVMTGWLFHIPVLTTPLPIWVTMKFTTALSFVLCGIMLFFLSKQKYDDLAEVMISLSSFSILLFMTTYLFFFYIGIDSGFEKLFVEESADAILSSAPGRPALITMYLFSLIALTGLLYTFHLSFVERIISWIGWMTIFIGTVPLIGYIFHIPILTLEISGFSTPLSFYAAVFFTLAGINLVLLDKPCTCKNNISSL